MPDILVSWCKVSSDSVNEPPESTLHLQEHHWNKQVLIIHHLHHILVEFTIVADWKDHLIQSLQLFGVPSPSSILLLFIFPTCWGFCYHQQQLSHSCCPQFKTLNPTRWRPRLGRELSRCQRQCVPKSPEVVRMSHTTELVPLLLRICKWGSGL